MELEVQKFLRGGGTLADLGASLGIAAKQSAVFPELWLLKYDQIDSPQAHPVVRECRGLILNSSDNWGVVAFPFKRFYNYGDGHADPIDWQTACVQEKLDGSLITMYWYDGAWQVATSGNPDAAGDVSGQGFSFRELFWKTFNEMGLPRPVPQLADITFMFELMTPYNRVVVRHPKARLALIGSRDRFTGLEHPADYWDEEFPVVPSFPLQSLDQIQATFDRMDPLQQEGYVVVDGRFNRIKVKHPGYVLFHHLKDSLTATKKNVVELIRRGEATEFTTHFPEYKADFDDARARFEQLVGELEAAYRVIADIPVQKDFALAVQAMKVRVPACMFTIRKQGGTVRSFLAEMRIDNLVEVLGL